MNRPNLVNLDRFKKKIRNVKSPNMTMPVQELKALEADLDELLLYTVELQAELIEAQKTSTQVTQVEIGGGDFFDKS